MVNEIYKLIKYRNRDVWISNFGNVHIPNSKAKPRMNNDGYMTITINNRSARIHRLVALAFIPIDSPDEMEVNHKDFNRCNNNLDNLEWLNHEENIKYSKDNGKYVPRYGKDNYNYGNTKLSKIYKENPELSKEKQSRPGVNNGMAKPISLFKDGELISNFNYIGECCEYLIEYHNFTNNHETIRVAIRRSIKFNRPYKGFTFIK